MVRVAAMTGGRGVPSARYRVRQYLGRLEAFGVSLAEIVSPFGAYPPPGLLARPPWALGVLATGLCSIARSYQFDAVLFQREMLSTFLTVERLSRRPRVLDVDDAIWMYRGGRFARKLAGLCELAICGNAFLASQFGAWCRRVEVLPTAVDTERYRPAERYTRDRVIGWAGSSSGFRYLYAIEPALDAVLQGEARLRILSDRQPRFRTIAPERVEFIPWSEETEVEALQGMTIGLMPVDDSPWARGKCAYKMLLSMSCGIPVVVSPVGMNAEVLRTGPVGIGAASMGEWQEAMRALLEDPEAAARMGQAGRASVLRHYSTDVIVPRLAALLRSVCG